jgi:hypothetical protein
MDEINLFVSQTGTVVVKCPQCENSKLISVATYKGKKFAIKVKCPCGHLFTINLDFREHYRKPTLLEGNYHKTNLKIESFYEKLPLKNDHPLKRIKNCTVRDLSIGGIGLDIWGKHTIEKGDELFIEFNLDNRKRSLIKCEVIVKTIRENYVGAEFKDKLICNSDLRFYLLS